MKAWTSGPYRLVAIDGTEVHQPAEVTGQSVTLTGGARADLEVKVPQRRHGGSRCSCPRRPQSSSDPQVLIRRRRHSLPTSWTR